MNRILVLAFAFLLSSCGDDKAKPHFTEKTAEFMEVDGGFSNVQSVEAELAEQLDYSFDKSILTMNKSLCSDYLVDRLFVYLTQSKSYLDYVKEHNLTEEDKAKKTLNRYNDTIISLGVILDGWKDHCAEEVPFTLSARAYDFGQQVEFNEKASHPLIERLNSLRSYKDLYAKNIEILKDGKTPSMQDIVELLIHQQAVLFYEREASNGRVALIRQAFQSVADAMKADILSGEKDLGDFKKDYERVIVKKINRKIYYNRAYFSAGSKMIRGKTQGYGGTILDLILNIKKRGDQYYNHRPVVIVSKGHILPGFVFSNNDQHFLYGVETIVDGKGLIYYGPLKDVIFQEEKVAVFDAYDFLVLTTFQYQIKYPRRQIDQAMRKFLKEYKLESQESIFAENFSSFAETGYFLKDDLGSNIFSFGKPASSVGNRSRRRFDEATTVGEYKTPQQTKELLKTYSNIDNVQNQKDRLRSFELMAF